MNKKSIYITSGAVILAIASGLISYKVYTNHKTNLLIQEAKNDESSGKYDAAFKIYQTALVNGNTNVTQSIESITHDNVDKMYSNLMSQKQYDKAIVELKKLDASFPALDSYLTQELKQAQNLSDSNNAFDLAQKQIDQKQFNDALTSLGKVTQEDTDNYKKAQSEKSDIQFQLIMDQAKQQATNGSYSEAIASIDKALQFKDDQSAKDLKNNYESAKKQAYEQKKAQLTSQTYIKSDNFKGINWRYANGTVTLNDGNFEFFIYEGEQGGKTWMRFVTGFNLPDWIFMKKVEVKTDKSTFEIPFDYFSDRKTQVGFGTGIYEWFDVLAEDNFLSKLKDVVNSNNSVIRFTGDTYYKDFTISDQQKQALKTMLDYYDLISTQQ